VTEHERRAIIDAVAAEQRAAGVTDPTVVVGAIRRAIECAEGLVTSDSLTATDLAELAEICFWAQDWHALDVLAIVEHPARFDVAIVAAARAQCAAAITARNARLLNIRIRNTTDT